MKKITGIILFLSGSLAVSAQNASLGPTIGINGWKDVNKDVKVGLNIGATFIYSIDPHWGLGADLKFSQEGGGKTIFDSNTGYYKTANLTESYIRLPIKAMYFFGKRGQRFRPKLYAGPSLGFLVGGKINATISNVLSSGPPMFYAVEQKSTDYLKHFDLGILVGTGFNYRIGTGTWLNVDLGYTGGLLNIIKDNANITALTSLPSVYNKSLSLNVGVAFPIGSPKTAKPKGRNRK